MEAELAASAFFLICREIVKFYQEDLSKNVRTDRYNKIILQMEVKIRSGAGSKR